VILSVLTVISYYDLVISHCKKKKNAKKYFLKINVSATTVFLIAAIQTLVDLI